MKKSNKVMKVGAILLAGGLAVGVCITAFGMIRTFIAIGKSGAGPPPEQVAETIGHSMVATSISMYVSFLGLCLVIGAYWAGRKRCDSTEKLPIEHSPSGSQSRDVANP